MNNTKIAYQANTFSPSILRHLAANFYDLLLIFALCCVITGAFLGIKTQFAQSAEIGAIALSNYERYLLQALLGLGIYSFYIYFWVRHGNTLGMQTWKLKLVNTENKKVTFRQANLRFFCAIISYGCVGLGILWKLFDKQSRCWHDMASKTYLVVDKQ